MDYRNVTIPQKDMGEVLASFDKSIQDHVQQLTILYPLSVHTLELPASDDGALGFTFLGVVESAAEHLRDKIAAWTSWLHSSAAASESKQKDMQPYTLLDLQSRTKPDEEEAPILSSNAMHNLLPSEDSEATLVFPLEPHNQRHPNLSNWCFPTMHNQSPPSPGQLDISPSYGSFDLNTMSHAAPVHGLQSSSETIADVAASSSDDRGVHLGTEATFEPCIEYSPGDVGLFVESSNQASPISNLQSLADSAIEGRANSHPGHGLLAAIDPSRGHDSELRAKSDTESHAFDIKIQPGISVEFDTDAESSNDMLAAPGTETSHKEDTETRHDGKHRRHLDSVDKLIDIAVEHIDARNLFCQNPAQFRQKLGQFRPRTFVDDTALLQLLRMISEDTKLRVVDPLHLRLGEPFPSSLLQEISVDLDGLVVPINVNASDQMSDANMDHWVLAVANWSTRTFDAFGMQRDSFHYWCSRIESLASEISGEPVKFRKKSHELGPYVDDSCCAFLCSYALDRYVSANLRHNGPWPTGPELREIYLRRLLNHWGLPSGFLPYRAQQMDFDLVDSPQSTVASSFSRSSDEVRCTEGHHHCLSSDLRRYSRNSGRDLGQLTEALNATGSALKIEQRARLIQMIMECGPLPENDQGVSQLNSGSCSLKELFQEVREMEALLQSHGFQQRRLLVETAKEFQAQLKVQEQRRNRARKRAKKDAEKRAKEAKAQARRTETQQQPEPDTKLARASKRHGQNGQCKPSSGERLESVVIRNATGLRVRKPRRTVYWKFVEEGRVLQQIEEDLGCNALRFLPGSTIRPYDMALEFSNGRKCFPVLRKSLEPILYNTLKQNEIEFFTEWFKVLRPELRPYE